jgi:PAS domain S-box-containing protein
MATKKVVKKRGKTGPARQADSGSRAEKRGAKTDRKVATPLPQERQKSLGELRKRLKEIEKQNEQLRETQKRLEYLASFPEMNPNPVVGLTVDGSVQYLNPATRRLFPDLQSKGLRHAWLANMKSVGTSLQGKKKASYVREIRIGDVWFEQLFSVGSMQDQIRVYGRDITERKLAEESLRQSEEKFRVLADKTYDMEFWINPEGRYVFVSPSCERITGHNPLEFMKDPGLRRHLVHPEDLPVFDRHLQQHERDDDVSPQEIEFRIIRPDGTIRWIGHFCQRIFDGSGRYLGIRATNRDITERKNTEEEQGRLRAEAENERRRLEAVMEALPVGVAITNAKGGVIRVNQAYDAVWGEPRPTSHSVSDYEGYKAWWAETGKPVAPEEWASAQAVQKGRVVVGQLLELQRFDGSRAFVINSGAPIFDMDGKIAGSAVAIQDITQLRKAKEALQRSEKRYRSLIDMTEQLGWTTNAHGEVVEDMPAWRKFTGQSAEEIRGWGWSNAVHPDDLERVAQVWKNAVATKKNYEVEYRIRRYDGMYRHFLVRGVPVLKDDGNVQEWMGTCIDITERQQMEEELRRSRDESESKVQERTADLAKANELLERMFSSIDVSIAYMDKDFNFIRVNRAYAKADGREPEFYIGKSHFGLFPNKENEQIFKKVVETGEPYSVHGKPFEYEEHPERGVPYWDWSLQPVKDPDGVVTGVVLSLMNVTERVQAQDSVEAERRRFNAVLEILPAYLVLLTPDYHVAFANQYFRERFGEARGRRCFEYLFGRSEPCDVCENYIPLKTMAPHKWEWNGPDGRIYQVFDFPFTDTDGSTLILEMGMDITERKKAEEALMQREALLRAIFETLPLGVWITDKQGRIIDGNQAGKQIWAGARYGGIDQFGDYKGWWLDTGRLIESEDWAVARAIRKGEASLNEEIEIECFDGSRKIILNSAVPIRNERQEILGAFIVNEDITDRKRAERNQQQAQKMEALGTLAGGVAHDFNNILMPITINTELALLDTPEGSPLRPYLQPVLDAAKRGKDLVGQIITFSRQRETERKPVNVGPIVREAIRFLRSSLPKNIEIQETVEFESDTILGDPTQIHQVLMNLSHNAAYAMREGGGTLDVRLTRSEVDLELAAKHPPLKQGPHVKLTVSDTGCGMSRGVMERIFDPFFTTKKPGEGTGMGLAVVHGIVKNHKGAITVYSETGKGTTFNVFLPRIQDEIKVENGSLQSIPTGKERILIVDDEEPQMQSVTRMLEKLGYSVVGKSDSQEALDAFRAEFGGFDLVITDQAMPKMTGEELAKCILDIRPDVPIILCTGFSEIIDADEAKALGIREFVMKPFTVREMAEKVRKVLGK